MIVTNIGGPVTVGPCHLAKGANEVQQSIWQGAKEHRLIQAFMKSGRIIEGAAAMPGQGVLPPGAVPYDPDNLPRLDPRRGIPTAANLKKAPAPVAVAVPVPGVVPAAEPEAAETATEQPVAEPVAEPEAAPDATEYAAADARLMIKDCTDMDVLKGWQEKETRKTVIAEIDARLAELQS